MKIRSRLLKKYRAVNREGGQSIAEFALTVGTLFLLIFAVIDLGRAISVYTYLAGAAQSAARVGAVSTDMGAIEAAAQSHMEGYGSEPMTIAINQTSEYTEVTLDYDFELAVPLVASAIGKDSLVLSNTARIRRLGNNSGQGGGGQATPGSTSAATNTPGPPTNTPPATNTQSGSTNTPQPTSTPGPPTSTPGPATDTPVPTATDCWPPGQCKP